MSKTRVRVQVLEHIARYDIGGASGLEQKIEEAVNNRWELQPGSVTVFFDYEPIYGLKDQYRKHTRYIAVVVRVEEACRRCDEFHPDKVKCFCSQCEKRWVQCDCEIPF